MTREQLIEKWLDYDLNAHELEAFKQLEDYDALLQMNEALQGFKAGAFDHDLAYKTISQRIASKPKKTTWVSVLSKIAAVLLMCFGLYYFMQDLSLSTNETLVAQQETVILPDASSVQLNAMSSLTFQEQDWDNHRVLKLNGEAYFKVAKGSKFEVQTQLGTVTVLGTQFNVKQRGDLFEVVCFEGKVAVVSEKKEQILLPGDTFLIRDGNYVSTDKERFKQPSWLNHASTFKSVPYKEVIEEFERQYDVKIQLNQINTNQLFTGSFTHNDIGIALKSITLPLQLKYVKKDKTIILTGV